MRAKAILVNAGLVVVLVFANSIAVWGQAATSIRGTISDPSGAVIPGAAVVLTDVATGVQYKTVTGAEGGYEFPRVLPGTCRLAVEAEGFRRLETQSLQLLVNTPATLNLTLEVGRRTETVSVSAEAQVLNTTDAALGIPFSENQVKQLPLEARNVVGLLSLQPGVAYTGNRPDVDPDYDTRSGAVNGARSDQSNVTLDGVDVNDQANGYAFTSVLRVTLDSVQEFRVTTTNYNADQGRSSGAQVSLVTKGGTNDFHGSAYWYHRNTATSANDWFIKRAQLDAGEKNQAPKLIRNMFGASLGGPIKRDRAFFFLNFEGRRDASAESVVRVVPTETLRQGEIRYGDVDGDVVTLSSQDLIDMDPLHIGPNPVVMDYFQSYPVPNDSSVGDGLNFSGYRFPGPVARRFDTYIARLDYRLTSSGNHSLFFRGNAQPYDVDRGVPFLPGRPPLTTDEDFSKGFVLGYSSIFRPNLVGNFRWGLTRQSHAVLGSSNLPWNYFRTLDHGITRSRGFTLRVHNVVGDISWVKGKHSFGFGTNLRIIRNPRLSYLNSFSDGRTNASWLMDAGIANKGGDMDPALYGFPAVDPAFNNAYDFPLIALLGSVTQVHGVYNYDKQGNLLPQGAAVPRHFGVNEYELYFQDSFRIEPNLTLTYGLRYELGSPPWETTGLQVAPNVNMGDWFRQRGINMRKGIPSSQDPLISFELGGLANGKPGFYPWDKRNFSPRLAFAYSPRPSSGFLKRLFGESDKTAIRAGFGLVYDRIGMGLLSAFDQNGSFGLSTTITNPAIQTLACAPRITDMNVIPTQDCTGLQILTPAPPGGFPQTPPSSLDTGGFSISWGLDNSIRTPYSYMLDFSITRELSKNFTLEAAYVGRLSHRLLVQEDLAMPLDLVDPTTGIDYFSAAAALSRLGAAGYRTPDITDSLVGPTAAYWSWLFGPPPAGGYPVADGSTNSAVQAAFDLFSDPYNGFLHNETLGLFFLDYKGYPAVPVTGYNSFYNQQYSSLYAWRSIGNSNYHALQLSLRKRMGHGAQFDFNYTWSKSIDIASDAERVGAWGGLGGTVINSWSHKQLRAVSDFDAAHQINANWIVELPFGQGRRLGRNARGVLQAIIGGWQTSGLFRWTTGFPVNVFNGYTWTTNWMLGGQAMLKGAAPRTKTTKNPDGTVNIFPDPSAAIDAFRFALPGESGVRNAIRGDGYFGLDMGLGKRWKMPYAEGHSLQFRWEVFNVSNSTRFDLQTNTPELDVVSAFGNYTHLLTSPRVMQFALRYEF